MESKILRLHDQAIDSAIAGDWKRAIQVNSEIIELDENNLDAYLAIGFAYLQTGQFEKSATSYKKALVIEPGNSIARNNLDKLMVLKKKNSSDTDKSAPSSKKHLKEFINVVGKTKIIELANIGQSEVLAGIKVGEQVELKSKKRRVEVRTLDGEYIGALPDDISKRLLFFIEAGSKYRAYIKSALKNQVEVFLSEEKKGAKVKSFVSFPKNIQDDLKGMMQSLNKDEEDEETDDEEKDENVDDTEDENHVEFVDKGDHAETTEDEETEGLTDLDALAADIDDDPHDGFITNLSSYNEGSDDEEEE